nr:uncharacterized protein LOC123749710 [Procambarus clarkii]
MSSSLIDPVQDAMIEHIDGSLYTGGHSSSERRTSPRRCGRSINFKTTSSGGGFDQPPSSGGDRTKAADIVDPRVTGEAATPPPMEQEPRAQTPPATPRKEAPQGKTRQRPHPEQHPQGRALAHNPHYGHLSTGPPQGLGPHHQPHQPQQEDGPPSPPPRRGTPGWRRNSGKHRDTVIGGSSRHVNLPHHHYSRHRRPRYHFTDIRRLVTVKFTFIGPAQPGQTTGTERQEPQDKAEGQAQKTKGQAQKTERQAQQMEKLKTERERPGEQQPPGTPPAAAHPTEDGTATGAQASCEETKKIDLGRMKDYAAKLKVSEKIEQVVAVEVHRDQGHEESPKRSKGTVQPVCGDHGKENSDKTWWDLVEHEQNRDEMQEHNVQDVKKLDVLLDYFEILINPTTLLKGGTMILIGKRAHIKVLNTEMDDNGELEKLYKKVNVDQGMRKYFLGKCTRVLTQDDNTSLLADVDKQEV